MSFQTLFEKTLVEALQADVPLSAAVIGIYAGVAPQAADSGDSAAFPYLVIEDSDFLEYHDAGHTGWELLLTIMTHSRSPGRKETKDIQGLLFDALHRQQASLTVVGYSILFIDLVSSGVEEFTDADGSFEGRCDYRAVMTRNAAD